MFISQAWAQGAAAAGAGTQLAGTFIQIIGIVLVFYLLLIRPQQKRMKQHEAKLQAIKIGDQILTGGGLYGVVRKIEADDITAEVAKGVEVKMPRFAIREVLTPEPAAKTSSKKTRK